MALICLDFFKNLTWLNHRYIDNKNLLQKQASHKAFVKKNWHRTYHRIGSYSARAIFLAKMKDAIFKEKRTMRISKSGKIMRKKKSRKIGCAFFALLRLWCRGEWRIQLSIRTCRFFSHAYSGRWPSVIITALFVNAYKRTVCVTTQSKWFQFTILTAPIETPTKNKSHEIAQILFGSCNPPQYIWRVYSICSFVRRARRF